MQRGAEPSSKGQSRRLVCIPPGLEDAPGLRPAALLLVHDARPAPAGLPGLLSARFAGKHCSSCALSVPAWDQGWQMHAVARAYAGLEYDEVQNTYSQAGSPARISSNCGAASLVLISGHTRLQDERSHPRDVVIFLIDHVRNMCLMCNVQCSRRTCTAQRPHSGASPPGSPELHPAPTWSSRAPCPESPPAPAPAGPETDSAAAPCCFNPPVTSVPPAAYIKQSGV